MGATRSRPPRRWVQRGSQVGPAAKALTAYLHHSLGISFAKIVRLFAERLGLTVTAGAICQASQSTSTDLVPVDSQIRARINASPVVAMDETGVRNEVAHIEWLRGLEGQLLMVT